MSALCGVALLSMVQLSNVMEQKEIERQLAVEKAARVEEFYEYVELEDEMIAAEDDRTHERDEYYSDLLEERRLAKLEEERLAKIEAKRLAKIEKEKVAKAKKEKAEKERLARVEKQRVAKAKKVEEKRVAKVDKVQKKQEKKKVVGSTTTKKPSNDRQSASSEKAPSRGNEAGRGKLLGTFEATAYDDTPASQGKWVGQTATGMKPQVGVIAVDPRVIPLHTKLYVEGYGNAIAGDTGGAIKGRRIDLFFNTPAEVRKYGRRQVKVWMR